MFDFRNLEIPTCTYKEMALQMIKKTVLPIASVYGNKNKHFTLIQTFDRRADQTKGCTEATRACNPISPLEYSDVQIDSNELIKSYKTRWLDRDYGRQKIITAYVRFCQKSDFLKSLNLPHNFTHVVIGGNCGIYASYTVDFFGNLSLSVQDYAWFHAEADTVVSYALNQFLKNNTDLLLLGHSLIQDLLRQHNVSLYCAIHSKLE